jgi:hypothetical protein
MKAERTDERLRELFAEMRCRDESAAPSFGRLMREPPRQSSVAWLRLAAVAGVAVLSAGLLLLSPGGARNEADLKAWASLSEWQATTDMLLTMSETPWSRASLSTTDAWIDDVSSVYETTDTQKEETL